MGYRRTVLEVIPSLPACLPACLPAVLLLPLLLPQHVVKAIQDMQLQEPLVKRLVIQDKIGSGGFGVVYRGGPLCRGLCGAAA